MSTDRRVMTAATLLAFLAVGAILYFAAVAFIPVALALFFALLLSPAVEGLQRLRMPRALAAAIVMLALLLAGVAIVDGVSTPAKEWLARAPHTSRKIEQCMRPVSMPSRHGLISWRRVRRRPPQPPHRRAYLDRY